MALLESPGYIRLRRSRNTSSPPWLRTSQSCSAAAFQATFSLVFLQISRYVHTYICIYTNNHMYVYTRIQPWIQTDREAGSQADIHAYRGLLLTVREPHVAYQLWDASVPGGRKMIHTVPNMGAVWVCSLFQFGSQRPLSIQVPWQWRFQLECSGPREAQKGRFSPTAVFTLTCKLCYGNSPYHNGNT